MAQDRNDLMIYENTIEIESEVHLREKLTE